MAITDCCKLTAVVCLVLALAVTALLRSQEARIPSDSRIDYFPEKGWLRETAQWDGEHGRFLVSRIEGGIGAVPYSPQSGPVREHTLVSRSIEPPFAGLSTNGLKIDPPRHRVLAAIADLVNNKCSAVAAYDIRNWEQIFFLKLAGPERASLADDVTVDEEGNIYVTDALGALIWKVAPDGSSFDVLTERGAFAVVPKIGYLSFATLNGISYHPEGFLLVVHTSGECLFKVSLDGQSVERIEFEGSLYGDGIALVSPTQLAVAGLWTGVKLVESSDMWVSANITHVYATPRHRVATSVTVKDGDVFVNYLIGQGYPYYSTIGRAAFTPVSS
ncbi:hypothetical protein KP509_19G001500 [Ceratopteris richardii]|uniref:Strictosidine synthase conserved region domain-containing protein n=1 Tax=Ceratopteris richardii TaxID=49495 RepID=A0A8T2SKL4_CERRI|nr:hypothetical protein KP509_19G001500 [Ceratopteris richardii]